VAATDDIEVIPRHMSDLKDFIYVEDNVIQGGNLVHDVK
jgi:hypothetical protein